MIKYEPVIGLEIHVQLKTKSKMFCACDNSGESKPPNTTICPICTGQPGVLPSINAEAVRLGLLAALALNCKISKESIFERKSYFYPDLPKGYQISQYTTPLGSGGHLIITGAGASQRIQLERVHLEEDTGKLLHEPGQGASYVDYNRSGTPLIEIVTRPVLPSPESARIFLQELRLVMRYLNVSDADMEKGHLRCDANISLRPNPEYFLEKAGADTAIGLDPKKLYPKTEIKNLNSFRAVERALEYETRRQTKLWDDKKAPQVSSTRGWDDKEGETLAQREKEEQHDYRYFPEPDLAPLVFDKKSIEKVKLGLGELPDARRRRLRKQYALGGYDINILVTYHGLAEYFEKVISELRAWLTTLNAESGNEEEIWERDRRKLVKTVTNWLVSRLFGLLNEDKKMIEEIKVTPENFSELMILIYQHKLNNQSALSVLKEMYKTGGDPSDIMESGKMEMLGDAPELEGLVDGVLKSNPDIVSQYKSGKVNTLQFLIGKVMKESKGRADAQAVKELLLLKLK